MSRFFPLPIGILCVQREKPLAVKQARHVGSLSSACQHPISHTFLAILFFLQIFCAFTKKEKVSLFKKKLLLRTARERESDLRAWWCQYRSRGGFQVEIGPPPTIFFAQRLFVGLSVVFFFLFRLPLLLFALLSFRVVGYQVVQFRCRQRHKKVQHIHPGGSFSSPRRLPRKRAHTKTKQTQLGHKEKKRKEKKRKDTHKKRVCVLVYSEEREREKLHSSIKVSLVFPDRSIIITYGLATPTCRWRVYFKKVTSMPEWKSIYVPSLVEVIFQRYGVAFNYIMTHRLGNGRE